MAAALLVRRILLIIPAMLAMSAIVFFIIRFVPGDPALVMLGLRSTPENLETLRDQLHLNDPVLVQYGTWLGKVATGDLGTDYRTNEPITEQLLTRLPVTLEMALLAMTMSALLGIPLGIIAAVKRGGLIDRAASTVGLFGISVPDFWIGVMLILIMALVLGWFPSSGYVPMDESLSENLRHMFLPALTLAINFVAVLTRTTRAAVRDVLDRPFVRTAHAKGLREQTVILGHIVRNAAIPVLTVMGLQLGYALGGAIIIEQVFSLPGIGRLTLNAVLERNYPVVQGAVLLISFLFLLINLVVDVLYTVVDPRLRGAS